MPCTACLNARRNGRSFLLPCSKEHIETIMPFRDGQAKNGLRAEEPNFHWAADVGNPGKPIRLRFPYRTPPQAGSRPLDFVCRLFRPSTRLALHEPWPMADGHSEYLASPPYALVRRYQPMLSPVFAARSNMVGRTTLPSRTRTKLLASCTEIMGLSSPTYWNIHRMN